MDRAGRRSWLCVTCGNEYPPAPTPPDECLICVDDRQYVPAAGQQWRPLRLDEERSVAIRDLEPGLRELTVDPRVGIGQRTFLVESAGGLVVWEPPGFVGSALVERLRAAGPIAAIASSHPHLVGASVALSHLLGRVPVYVHELDRRWVTRPDDVVVHWRADREIAPGIRLVRCGGHFPGSCVLQIGTAAEGRGALLSGDTVMVNPDRATVSFMRSYPNLIPLSPRLVRQIVAALDTVAYDRIYGAFGNIIDSAARAAVHASAARYLGWLTDEIRDPDDPGPA
ncbi:hydrolase [Gordonia alkaliphila]|uniref:hydrolase n=1 Tax=Gordonia alkaliphila TaxID=1053547 RepID=UPI001FF157AD|nr:hydrolase [Gordonia alkaliphila]MCK0438190.1 hydrolase [Gordonia alkaliphila]